MNVNASVLLLYLVVKVPPCPHSFHCHESYVQIHVFLSELSWSIHTCCSTTIYFFQRPLLPAQQVTAPFFSFQHNIWFITSQCTYHFVGIPYGNIKNISVNHCIQIQLFVKRNNDKIHLSFTWGVLCVFWVLGRRGVAGLGVSARVEDLDVANAWNLFLSTLPV